MKKLYGVGTGPGAKELLTLKAVEVIKSADIIFAPNNKGKNMALDTTRDFIEGKDLILIDFPMGNTTKEDYIKVADVILNNIPKDGIGVFLTIGDSMIYSTFIYILNELLNMEINIEIVPGIPSFVASAAEVIHPLTLKGDNFVLCDECTQEILDVADSVAILKTSKNKEALIDLLEKNNMSYSYIKRVSLEQQEILNDKESILEDSDYMSLILARKNNIY